MKKLSVFLSLVFLLSSPLIAGTKWISLGKTKAKEVSVKLLESDINKTIIEVTVPGFNLTDLDIKGKPYKTISIPKASTLAERGLPELPKINTNVIIPDSSRMDVEILEEETVDYEVGPIAPSKGTIYRNQNPALVPYSFNKTFYDRDELYPEKTVILGSPYIVRDVRGINIQVQPIRYNPADGSAKIVTKLVIALNAAGEDTENVIVRNRKLSSIDEAFKTIYEEHFLNAARFLEAHDIVDAGSMLVITHDAFLDGVLPLVQWKLQKGIKTKVVKISEIGLDPIKIKEYIQNYYNTQGLTYVLLVGDADQVPPFPGTAGNVVRKEADPMYVLLAGTDSYPDAIISRFSAETMDHVKIQVAKAIRYEMTPDTQDGSWYERAAGIAGDDAGGNPSYKDFERVEFLRTKLLNYKYGEVLQLYHRPPTEALYDAFHKGLGYVNYINHGSTTSWPIGSFDTTKIAALKNYDKWPFIVSVACVNGQFKGYTCLGEAFARAGTPEKPAGSVAIYASSTNQSWVPPCVGQSKIVDLLTAEKKQTIGALYFNGVMAVLDDNDGSAVQTYQSWHLFGDGSVPARTKKSASIAATHDEKINAAAGSFTVSAKAEGLLVSLYADNTIYGTGYTDKTGVANVKYTAVPGTVKNVALTVTGFNKTPYFKNLTVVK